MFQIRKWWKSCVQFVLRRPLVIQINQQHHRQNSKCFCLGHSHHRFFTSLRSYMLSSCQPTTTTQRTRGISRWRKHSHVLISCRFNNFITTNNSCFIRWGTIILHKASINGGFSKIIKSLSIRADRWKSYKSDKLDQAMEGSKLKQMIV